MEIIKKDSFRSKGNDLRQCDDMYRLVIDMNRIEYAKFTQWKSDNASSPKLPTLDQFVKEAKRFQKEGDTLGGVTFIDIVEHLHEFAFRKPSTKCLCDDCPVDDCEIRGNWL